MPITWFDSEDESEGEISNKVMDFTEDVLEEELDYTYRLFLTQWKEACLREEKQKNTISPIILEKEKFGSTIASLEEEVTFLKFNLDNMTKFVCMLNNGFDMLD